MRDIFGDTTFLKGLDYYNHGYVSNTVKIGDILYSQVLGSSPKPYEVRAFISDAKTSTKCTCPVGFMCKHGAALLLKWVNEPSSFVDADKFPAIVGKNEQKRNNQYHRKNTKTKTFSDHRFFGNVLNYTA